MSITSEINRIKNNIADAYDALENKGATMPAIENSDNLPSTIESITGGSGLNTIINQNLDGISPLYVWNGTEEEWNNGETSGFYNWTSGESSIGTAVATTLPSSQGWYYATYGNGKFVTVAHSTDVFAYSTDGINWTEGTLPSSQNWRSVAYGNGKFVAVVWSSGVFAYSSDGVNWTQGTMPSSKDWWDVSYGNGKFVAIAGGGYSANAFAYSSDGVNWTQGTMPSSRKWISIAYGNGKFVAIADGSNAYAYSSDGIQWTAGTLPSSRAWSSVTYGNGKFVAVVSGSDVFAYSSDGVNWTQGTMPSSNYWYSITYGNEMFVAIAGGSYNRNIFAYSYDGINWTQGTLSSYGSWRPLAYGADKFVAVASDSSTGAYIPVTAALSAFTDTETPDTSSTIYSEPSVESSLTITETGTNTITLSDGNVYDRNQAGDVVVTQSIGEAHPDYISFIDGVGVRIGTTDIADI